jgi:hypothetical protein
MATTRFFVGVLALIGARAPAHAARNYRVGAFYYGPWHVDPANEKLHGKNWTEWNLVKVITQTFNSQQPMQGTHLFACGS